MGVGDPEPRDLPVLRTGEDDLPILVAPERATHERAAAVHPGWQTFAGQTEVRGIATADDGEIWVATAGGVLRWRAGDRFTRYGSEHGLPSTSMTAVALDGERRAWLLDADGVISCFDRAGWSILDLGRAATCIGTDRLGRVWAGTDDGLRMLDPAMANGLELSFDGIRPVQEPPRALAVADENDAWICSAAGLWRFDGEHWHQRSRRSGLTALGLGADALWVGSREGITQIELEGEAARSWPLGMTTSLCAAGDEVWAAGGRRVSRFRAGSWEPAADLGHAVATAVAAIGSGEICIGTESSLLRGPPGGLQPLATDTAPDSIDAGTLGGLVHALATARRGGETIIWVGTSTGLFELRPEFNRWRRIAALRVAGVSALIATDDGLHIGSWPSGLRALSNGAVGPALLDQPVLALAAGAEPGTWLIGTVAGVHELDRAGIARLLVAGDELQRGGVVRALAAAPDGRVWIGTSSGLFTYSRQYGPAVARGEPVGADVLAMLAPRSAAEGPLVGTECGLYHGDSEVTPLRGLEVTALAWAGRDDGAWVGTATGLFRITQRAGKWVVAAEVDARRSGLAGNRITALSVDPDGGVWVGTTSGLSAYRAT